jgi:hypothetical protein
LRESRVTGRLYSTECANLAGWGINPRCNSWPRARKLVAVRS